jgi:hypothetical protein
MCGWFSAAIARALLKSLGVFFEALDSNDAPPSRAFLPCAHANGRKQAVGQVAPVSHWSRL